MHWTKQYHQWRLRFVADNVFLFHADSLKILHFAVDDGKISFVAKLTVAESRMTDFTVTDCLLIIRFKQWLGVYTLYPSLKWHHVECSLVSAVVCLCHLCVVRRRSSSRRATRCRASRLEMGTTTCFDVEGGCDDCGERVD